MRSEHQIVKAVYAAKKDLHRADELIKQYLPFIRTETSRCIARICTEQDDELSIAMIAFHEAIMAYEHGRGAFLNYAALRIRSRIIDYQRKEARHQGNLSLYETNGDEEQTILDIVADERDHYEELNNMYAVRQEIEELSAVLREFSVSFSDAADNSPKQERTLEACTDAIRYAAKNQDLLDELLRTKKLPIMQLVKGSGAAKKTLERHRKYILVMVLIHTNGYEILRGHVRHILTEKGGMPA